MSNNVKVLKHLETPRVAGVYYRLLCLTGENKGKAYYLLGKRAVMGRSEKCDITILDLKSSREHAEIILVGDDYILTDLGSQNGIIVNDLKIKQHVLNEGDKVIVGKTVYKFSKIEVKEESSEKKKTKNKKVVESPENTESEPENKKLTMILGAFIVVGILLLFSEDAVIEEKVKNNTVKGNVKEIDESFAKALKQKSMESKKNKEKLALYFKRGLREYREGNYFRAISEFENAQQWSPNDPLASFYLRKTRESLDEQIESFFSKAIRDSDAVNYQKAVISYCSIIRLLDNFQKDERYIAAMEGLRNLEKKMGLDEGEIICLEKEKGKK